jgi:predicted TIM-barrel fold metal-dependent hydrolase
MTTQEAKIDVHMHLAGTGCCGSGIRMSPWFQSRYTYKLLRFKLRISDEQMRTTVDEDWPKRMSDLIAESQIDYGVVLGFDGVFNADGSERTDKLQMSIPSKWVFDVCRKHKNLLPGPSINPYKKGALEELAQCIENGAVLIKWLPCTQDINPADVRIDEFYAMLAKAKVPLLVHMGGERTFHTVNEHYNDVRLLRHPLECGVTVICAHSATRIQGSSEVDRTDELIKLLEEFPNLWVDNSGLCTPVRFQHVPRLAKIDIVEQRTLYGSDWPVPANAFYYVGRMPVRKIISLERMKNQLDRDVAIKTHFGYSSHSLTRANRVLANLDKWITKN